MIDSEMRITQYIIITKIYIVHMPDGKISHQIQSESHKKVDLMNI